MLRKRCRHERNSWIIGGVAEWCYVCVAYRGLRWNPTGDGVEARTNWVKPTGDRDNNPYEKLRTMAIDRARPRSKR